MVGEGEDVREGAEYADPFAIVRQLSVARYAFRSWILVIASRLALNHLRRQLP